MVEDLIKSELKNFKSPLYRNSLYISLASLTTAVAGFVFWNIAAHFYSPADIGLASAMNSILLLLVLMSKLGLDFALIRFYPIYKEESISSSLIIVLFSSTMFSLGYIVINKIGNTLEVAGDVMLIVLLFSVVGSLLGILGNLFLVQRRGRMYFIQQLISVVVKISVLPFLVFLHYLGILSSIVLGLVFSLFFSCGYLMKYEKIPLTVSVEYIKASLVYAAGNYISTLLNFAPNYIMPTLVLMTLGKEQAAYYYIAFTIGNILLFVPNALNTSFFVEGSHGTDISKILKKVLGISLMYMFVAVIGVWIFGKWLLMLFGYEYLVGLELLRVIALSGFFVVVVNLYLTLLNIRKDVKKLALVNSIKAVTFLGLSYIMIQKFGLIGVGYAWSITHLSLIIFAIPKVLWQVKY